MMYLQLIFLYMFVSVTYINDIFENMQSVSVCKIHTKSSKIYTWGVGLHMFVQIYTGILKPCTKKTTKINANITDRRIYLHYWRSLVLFILELIHKLQIETHVKGTFRVSTV